MLLGIFSVTPAEAVQKLGNLSSSKLHGRMQILETLIEGRDLTEQQTQEAMEVCPLNHPFALKYLLGMEKLHQGPRN